MSIMFLKRQQGTKAASNCSHDLEHVSHDVADTYAMEVIVYPEHNSNGNEIRTPI